MRHVAGAAEKRARGNVDNLATALPLHDRDRRLTTEENAFQIYFNNSVPLRQIKIFDRSFPKFLRDVDRRVVEQHIDDAELFGRLQHQTLDILNSL